MIVSSSELRGWHTTEGEWGIKGYEGLKIRPASLVNDRLEVIKFDEIAHKTLPDKDTDRYKKADIRFPGIVAEGAPNPFEKKYRLCDGRHRLLKMKEQGLTEAVFRVITKHQFMEAMDKHLKLLVSN